MSLGPNPDVCGFMPEEEGRLLYELAKRAATFGDILEIGSYCGKSTIWLGHAVKETGRVVFAVDHHRGSEEHQPGEFFHDPDLTDEHGRFDTLPTFRRNIEAHDLNETVIPIITSAPLLAKHWQQPLGMVFIDGGHSLDAALADYRAWAPLVMPGGILAIHDVFTNTEAGGQAPFAIWQLALNSGLFDEIACEGSLRGLRRATL